MTDTTQDKLSYQKVLDGLLRMHELSVAGEQETDEIKQLRDAIDEPYADLSAEERATIEGLSTDLFGARQFYVAGHPSLVERRTLIMPMKCVLPCPKAGRGDVPEAGPSAPHKVRAADPTKGGLLSETATIGTRAGWQARLAAAGLTVRGHRVVRAG